MSLDKFRLTLDPGGANEAIYEGLGNISVESTGEYNFLVDGIGGQLIAAATQLAETGEINDSPMATPFLNAGAGRRGWEVNFDKWTGEVGQDWGNITNEITDPTADEKLTYLEDDLANRRPDSLTPAQFEFSIYDANGIRDPVPVVPTQYNPTVDFQESATTSRIRLTLVEALDLSGVIDDLVGNMNDSLLAFSFTPAGAASPELPVPIDTFVTRRLDQAQEVVENALDDPGGAFAAPAGEVEYTGLSPPSLQLEGVWRGSEAQSLAESFKGNFMGDPDVQQIDLTAKEASSTFGGTFTLADGPGTRVEPVDPRTSNLWRFVMDLREG